MRLMGRGVGWWVVSGSGRRGAKPDGLVIWRNQNQTLLIINMNISSCLDQCYHLSSHFTIRYYFIFPKKCKSVLSYFYLAKPPQVICDVLAAAWGKKF